MEWVEIVHCNTEVQIQILGDEVLLNSSQCVRVNQTETQLKETILCKHLLQCTENTTNEAVAEQQIY